MQYTILCIGMAENVVIQLQYDVLAILFSLYLTVK